MKFAAKGIISAMVTPFTKGGDYVDFDKVGPLAELLVKGGAAGLFPCGTTGEGPLMSPDERMTVVEEVVQAVGKKVMVIAHTGAFDTATSVELTQHAANAGAHAAALVAPGYYGYDDASLRLYYKTVADSVKGFPVLLYNLPSCARNALSAELILDLANSIDNIVGIKDSSGSMPLLTRLVGNAPKGFAVINGCDEHGFQAFTAGCPAVVSGCSNAVIDLYYGIYSELQKGNTKKAWAWQVKLEQAARIFQYGRKLSLFKEGMRLRGFDAGYVRPPQCELSTAEKKDLAKKLEAAGII